MTESHMKNLCIRYRRLATVIPIESLDFHYSGQYLVYAEDDLMKHIGLTSETVKEFQSVKCQKRGVGLVKYLDSHNKIALTTNKLEPKIRILDTEKQNYITEYSGHEDEITGINWSVCTPKIFISSSKDKTCKILDISNNLKKPIDQITFESSSSLISSIHPDGNTFTVIIESRKVQSFEVRKLGKPVNENVLNLEPNVACRGMNYSFDGNQILITTNSNCFIVADPSKNGNDFLISEFSGELSLSEKLLIFYN